MRQTIVVLPDIRSTHNVGSIFRTADAAGVSEVFLVGYTPQPVDRFGRERTDIAKVSLGAEKTVAWRYFKTVDEAFSELKKQNYTIVAIEQHKDSVSYADMLRDEKTAFVFGNEVDGLNEEILKQCDVIAEIPMRGDKESLNVSVTAGIILFEANKN